MRFTAGRVPRARVSATRNRIQRPLNLLRVSRLGLDSSTDPQTRMYRRPRRHQEKQRRDSDHRPPGRSRYTRATSIIAVSNPTLFRTPSPPHPFVTSRLGGHQAPNRELSGRAGRTLSIGRRRKLQRYPDDARSGGGEWCETQDGPAATWREERPGSAVRRIEPFDSGTAASRVSAARTGPVETGITVIGP